MPPLPSPVQAAVGSSEVADKKATKRKVPAADPASIEQLKALVASLDIPVGAAPPPGGACWARAPLDVMNGRHVVVNLRSCCRGGDSKPCSL